MVYYAMLPSVVERVNRELEVNGLKLLMTRAEVESGMTGSASFEQGFGGHGLRYPEENVRVDFLDGGRYKDMAVSIETKNINHSILGIRVGDSAQNLQQRLKEHSFKKNHGDTHHFVHGNVYLQVDYDEDEAKTIRRIRIGLEDSDRKSKVY